VPAIVAAATPLPTPSPGPCAQGALASISDRPGIGRSPATNGAACVAANGSVVIEAGYRNQVTSGAETQTLSTYPNPIVRIGLPDRNEIVLSFFTFSDRAGIDPSTGFAPAAGMQDGGIGFKHLLHDNVFMQDAVNVFVTLPTGYPSGPSGFTAGLPTYTLGYSVAFPLSRTLSFSTTHNLGLSAGPNVSGLPQRFLVYQPAGALSYALSSKLTFLAEDQGTFPTGPAGSSGNRALAGLQYTLSSRAVLDAEFELNLLPAPGNRQRAIDVGMTLLVP
jgi:hypothetical protein